MALPRISVVIAAHNAARTLKFCLRALAASDMAPLECLVVDDGSTDGTAEIARQFGARVLTTGVRKGPSHARNLGVRRAKGEVIFFVDADVCVHPDTVSRLSRTFEKETGIDAVIGSYDDSPDAEDVLSMYRNLLHRYVHQNGKREASTFWSGCGAIRRHVFIENGGFDESFGRAAIEDIEFGRRLTARGCRVLLDHGLEVKHLKRWTFLRLVKTDVCDRAIPWSRLILRDRCMPNDLNLRTCHRISVALAMVLVGLGLTNVLYYRGPFVVPSLAAGLLALACYWTQAGLRRNKGMTFGLAALIAAFAEMAYSEHMPSLIFLVLTGYLLLLIRYRYTYRTEFQRKTTGMAYIVYSSGSLVFIGRFVPQHIPVFCFYAVILLILAINRRFYRYLGQRMGWLTALAAVPFHLLFYFYSGVSFIIAAAMFSWSAAIRPARESQSVELSDSPL